MCDHRNLVYLGSQKTDGGYNQYLKCLDCGGVLIGLPSGKIYEVRKAKRLEHVSASPNP